MHARSAGGALLGAAGVLLVAWGCAAQAETSGGSTETLVIVRHGEKPEGGFGQIDCQGMNRALALPKVLAAKFGKPDFIFAPDPADATSDPAGTFDYIRPLATIEPTAVALGMPVHTPYGFRQIDALGAELMRPSYRGALVFIAWEHRLGEELARSLTSAAGVTVPRWESDDFDSIYIVRITTQGEERHASFEHDTEGLNGQSTSCGFAR